MRPQRIAASALVVLSVAGVDDAFAQTQLPPVSVDAPHRQSARSQQQPSQRTTRARSGARRATVAPVGAQPQSAQQAASAGGGHERANGPVTGYLARQSSSGTKTSTPIIQTPQSVTVIGAEQIRDQKIVSKFDEVLRYSPGVIGGTYGSDFRNEIGRAHV